MRNKSKSELNVEIIQGDITKLKVDVIVNAANTSLLGGGGVDGAIHRAAGPDLVKECKTLKGCETGEAKLTKGYQLPAPYVIHTVGPVWHGGRDGEATLLENCYKNSLQLALENKLQTIAFPAISTGVYGYPFLEAGKIALNTTFQFLKQNELPRKVVFVLFKEQEQRQFKTLFETLLS